MAITLTALTGMLARGGRSSRCCASYRGGSHMIARSGAATTRPAESRGVIPDSALAVDD